MKLIASNEIVGNVYRFFDETTKFYAYAFMGKSPIFKDIGMGQEHFKMMGRIFDYSITGLLKELKPYGIREKHLDFSQLEDLEWDSKRMYPWTRIPRQIHSR